MAEPKKRKIFIIDDDSFLLDMYALKFSQSNFEVDTAMGGMPALEKIQTGITPDVMLVDIVMPIMDGFELLEKLKAEHLLENTRKIILSNRGEQEDIQRGTALGVDGYIIKANSTPSEVVARIIEILDKK